MSDVYGLRVKGVNEGEPPSDTTGFFGTKRTNIYEPLAGCHLLYA
jgi:hypothetical protein